MEQQRALNALAPYIALSKSATSPRAAADLVTQATSAPQTYIFAELLQTQNIQALSQSPEYSSHLRLLEIFAWGSIADYNATQNLPPLSPTQHQKLLLLSLLPLCLTPTTLSYSTLTTALSLPSTRELEALITTAIYANLLTAHLDPLHQTVRVTSVAPLRDLAPGSVPQLTSVLAEWEARCTSTLDSIDAQISGIRRRARDERDRREREERLFQEQVFRAEEKVAKERGQEGLGKKIGAGSGGLAGKWGSLLSGKGGKRVAEGQSDDFMDVDELGGSGGGGGGSRMSKRKGPGGR